MSEYELNVTVVYTYVVEADSHEEARNQGLHYEYAGKVNEITTKKLKDYEEIYG
jgi:hypothetical protein